MKRSKVISSCRIEITQSPSFILDELAYNYGYDYARRNYLDNVEAPHQLDSLVHWTLFVCLVTPTNQCHLMELAKHGFDKSMIFLPVYILPHLILNITIK